MNRKQKRQLAKQQKQGNVQANPLEEKVESMTDKITPEEREEVEKTKEEIKRQIEGTKENVQRYCDSVDLGTQQFLNDMKTAPGLLEEEKRVIMHIAQISGMAQKYLVTDSDKAQAFQKIRELSQIFMSNALLRADQIFFKKLGY